MTSPDETLDELLARVRTGDPEAATELLTAMHGEIRRIARVIMSDQRPGHTLQATALVNEAFVRMAQAGPGEVDDLRHFIRKATRAMRSALIDHERARLTSKRGGGRAAATLDEQAIGAPEGSGLGVLDVDEALRRLEEGAPDLAAVVELRYFGGLEVDAVASALKIGKRTAERRWQLARDWLREEFRRQVDGGDRA